MMQYRPFTETDAAFLRLIQEDIRKNPFGTIYLATWAYIRDVVHKCALPCVIMYHPTLAKTQDATLVIYDHGAIARRPPPLLFLPSWKCPDFQPETTFLHMATCTRNRGALAHYCMQPFSYLRSSPPTSARIIS
jgi:hypothetical protein